MNPHLQSQEFDQQQQQQQPQQQQSQQQQQGGGQQQSNPQQQQQQYHGQQQKKNKIYCDLYKTKLCPLYQQGKCNKGANCTFAHDQAEIRKQPNLQKTKLCENWLKGNCQLGENCTFAHGENELRVTSNLYKTSLCINWQKGKCQNGENCRYAHGQAELRPSPYSMNMQQQEMNFIPPQFPYYPQMMPYTMPGPFMGMDQNQQFIGNIPNFQGNFPGNDFTQQMQQGGMNFLPNDQKKSQANEQFM